MLILELIGGEGGVGGAKACQLEVSWMETCARAALSSLKGFQQPSLHMWRRLSTEIRVQFGLIRMANLLSATSLPQQI